MQAIRNFAIIAHVDHGKSTLADRLLELTGTVGEKHAEQMLDTNPISRERGITIKLAPVRMEFRIEAEKNILNSELYILNLIDTPGHVDFSYEVERTLACVEGVILLVDATQGIQAQTIAHTYKALEQNLVIIPVINKIDLPQAQVAQTKQELAAFLGISIDDIYEISAKTGQGVEKLLRAIIRKIPPPTLLLNLGGADERHPRGSPVASDQIRALIFDSYYDNFRGVIAFVRVFSGSLKKGDNVELIATNTSFIVDEVGIFAPHLQVKEGLDNGEIGYIVTRLKDIHAVAVGDTLVEYGSHGGPLPGYKKNVPMVFSSLFPTDTDDFLSLKDALEKLTLNDAAVTYDPIFSKALGSGFRVGFLGLLHADVVRQRLEQEYDLSLVLTSPTVNYRETVDSTKKKSFEEPIVRVTIVTPKEYLGSVMKLIEDSRGIFVAMDNGIHVILDYEIPLAELIKDFFDRLKSVTSGFASLQWEPAFYRSAQVHKLEIVLNDELVEEFSEYIVSERSYERGRELVDRLKALIPRQQYEVKIQAKYEGKIIASARVAPYRKDVTAKLYGGDRTRKDKLLKKQKAGKKRMKQIGSVEIPKEVFFKVFRKQTS